MSFQKYFVGKPNDSFQNATILLSFPKNAHIVQMQQVHGKERAEISENSQNFETDTPISGIDACYTSQKNVFLSVKSADCLPILISGFGTSEKLLPFVAAAHAGRKSTEIKILYKLLEELNNTFAFVSCLKEKNKTLDIWFGPAICESCFQIDRKTDAHYNLIAENKKQILKFFAKYDLNPKQSLNLEIENYCTLHEPEKYYSYRATGPGVKMNYSFIGII